MRELRLLGFLIVTSLFVGTLAPALGWASRDFLTLGNLRDVLVNAAPAIIAACGMTVVIVSASIDISIGSTFAACAVAGAALGQTQCPLALAVLAPLVLGATLGAVNGVLIAIARIPAIIATLGMMTVVRGLTIYLTGGNEVRDHPLRFGDGQSLPPSLIIAAVVVAATAFFLTRTRTGRQIHALGGNETAAQLSTVPVIRHRLLTHAMCGGCVGLAALVHAARFSSIQPTMGGGVRAGGDHRGGAGRHQHPGRQRHRAGQRAGCDHAGSDSERAHLPRRPGFLERRRPRRRGPGRRAIVRVGEEVGEM